MMMRYQRVSPDCITLGNGKKPSLRPLSKEENNNNGDTSRTTPFQSSCTSTASFDGVSKGFRFRSPSRTTQDPQSADASPSRGGGDVLLQWGQRKRSRVSRAEIRSVTDDSSSSSGQGRQRLQRRASNTSMPPPPPPLLCGTASNGVAHKGPNLRNGFVTSKESSGFACGRNSEDRSAVANGSPARAIGGSSRATSRSAAGRRSPSSPDKVSGSGSSKDEKQNGCTGGHTDRVNRSDLAVTRSDHHEAGGGEKPNVEVIEWPRIFIALSRKEKEEDFLAMKGTKLPHRPRKRAKNIDKALQYCFPGMWLSDLTKSRYEVREKKSVKKQKRRGLKGLESMDSDSD